MDNVFIRGRDRIIISLPWVLAHASCFLHGQNNPPSVLNFDQKPSASDINVR